MSTRLIVLAILVSALSFPVLSRADDSIYDQCRKTCGEDGLSCVDRCVAAQRSAGGDSDNGNGSVVNDDQNEIDREDIENRAAAREEAGAPLIERREGRFGGFRRE